MGLLNPGFYASERQAFPLCPACYDYSTFTKKQFKSLIIKAKTFLSLRATQPALPCEHLKKRRRQRQNYDKTSWQFFIDCTETHPNSKASGEVKARAASLKGNVLF